MNLLGQVSDYQFLHATDQSSIIRLGVFISEQRKRLFGHAFPARLTAQHAEESAEIPPRD